MPLAAPDPGLIVRPPRCRPSSAGGCVQAEGLMLTACVSMATAISPLCRILNYGVIARSVLVHWLVHAGPLGDWCCTREDRSAGSAICAGLTVRVNRKGLSANLGQPPVKRNEEHVGEKSAEESQF